MEVLEVARNACLDLVVNEPIALRIILAINNSYNDFEDNAFIIYQQLLTFVLSGIRLTQTQFLLD